MFRKWPELYFRILVEFTWVETNEIALYIMIKQSCRVGSGNERIFRK